MMMTLRHAPLKHVLASVMVNLARAVCILCAVVVAASGVEAKVFSPASLTLANGLQVIVVSNPRAPVVSQMLWYKVGAADEVAGKTGLAHYLEHLMFKGTAAIPAGAFSQLIARQGGNDNAFTAYHYTAYFQQVAADRLPMIMQMEADRMQNLALTDAVTQTERDVILAERSQRIDDDPYGRFSVKMDEVLYGKHIYGRPVIGWRADMEKLTTADATDWYQRWYTPSNAVLIVSGDVRPAEVFALAAATYGRIPSRPTPHANQLLAPPLERASVVEQKDSDIRQPSWQRVWRAPNWLTNRKASAALEVLSAVLDSGESGWLYQHLVREAQVAVSANADYDDQPLAGSFSVSLVPAENSSIEKLQTTFDDRLHALLKTGIAGAEIAAAKKRLQREAAFARDSLLAPGYAFGMALTTGKKISDVENWPQQIAAVTPSDVHEALRYVLGNDKHVTGVLLPDSEQSPTPTPQHAAEKVLR